MSETLILETRGLAMAFGGLKVFSGLDFSMRPGERHAVIGPNGAGKSTFVGLLTGLLQPTAGTVWLNGQDITRATPAQRSAVSSDSRRHCASPKNARPTASQSSSRVGVGTLAVNSYTRLSTSRIDRFEGFAPAIVASEVRFIASAPSPAIANTCSFGRTAASPSATDVASPIGPET